MAKKLTDAELNAAIHEAVAKYHGYVPTLEAAIGALFLGKVVGWKVLLLAHNRSTLNKYEKILGVNFREQMELTTDLSRKSYIYAFAEKTKEFWKLVRGEISHAKRTWLAKDKVRKAVAKKSKGED